MPLKLNNTLTRSEEVFAPITSGKVLFYTCGPTVYDFAHIGNFRSFLAADLLRRWLESPLCERVTPAGEPEGHAFGEGGYEVTHVMNITDVGHMTDDDDADGGGEDKMEQARQRLLADKKSGKLPAGAAGADGAALNPNDPRDIAAFYADAFLEDAKKLGLKVAVEAEADASLMPRPTAMVRQMLAMICELIERGHAYVASDGVCYFDTRSFPEYGKLSGNTLDAIRSGAGGRVSDASQAVKKHPADFMLWKPDPKHLMRWDPKSELKGDAKSLAVLEKHPLGEGYPGWHIECSAMARERLGDRIDLHSGGEDNIFPHHECEIAQSRCATGQERFANYWFHPRFLQVEGEKMSKSKGNFFTARDLFSKGFSPAAVRLALINTHYRTNANFTMQAVYDAQSMIDKWHRILRAASSLPNDDMESMFEYEKVTESINRCLRDFSYHMNRDLNISGAIGAINLASRSINHALSNHPLSFLWQITNADLPQPMNKKKSVGILVKNERGHHCTTRDLVVSFYSIIDDVLGVIFSIDDSNAGHDIDISSVNNLINSRLEAKRNKEWKRADDIRDELLRMGVEITDTHEGTSWKVVDKS